MQNLPVGYDPVLLNHWLWYKYQCHECTFPEFQRLFENIIKRAQPDFISIRPYGNIGDRKCDGLLYADGASTVFQVYSPDELKLAEVKDKIEEDLAGAVLHWSDRLKRWVFVYNVRRGLAPDIPQLLDEKKKVYLQVAIDHLSSDGLWEMARGLTLQQRCEILGAPSGYEHLFFSTLSTNEEINQYLHTGSFVLVQDLLSPISLQAVSDALAPARPFGAPFFIRPTYGALPWTDAARQQQTMLQEVLEKGRELVPRFSVFSLAPIPLVIHLGFLLSDRVEVHCYQYDREAATWRWPQLRRPNQPDAKYTLAGLPESRIDHEVEVTLSVSLSAQIMHEDVQETAPQAGVHVEIGVAEPDTMWLRSPRQLTELARVTRKVLATLRSRVPRCTRLHLLYAGPTGGALTIGQQINPRMNPPVELYQFSQQAHPRYRHALTLTEDLS